MIDTKEKRAADVAEFVENAWAPLRHAGANELGDVLRETLQDLGETSGVVDDLKAEIETLTKDRDAALVSSGDSILRAAKLEAEVDALRSRAEGAEAEAAAQRARADAAEADAARAVQGRTNAVNLLDGEVGLRIAAIARAEAAERERDEARADVVAAAGELEVDIPAPGTDMARVVVANRIMRAERDEAQRAVAVLRAALEATRCYLCNNTGSYYPHCWKCDDSGHDHVDCPPKRACDDPRCVARRAALSSTTTQAEGWFSEAEMRQSWRDVRDGTGHGVDDESLDRISPHIFAALRAKRGQP